MFLAKRLHVQSRLFIHRSCNILQFVETAGWDDIVLLCRLGNLWISRPDSRRV